MPIGKSKIALTMHLQSLIQSAHCLNTSWIFHYRRSKGTGIVYTLTKSALWKVTKFWLIEKPLKSIWLQRLNYLRTCSDLSLEGLFWLFLSVEWLWKNRRMYLPYCAIASILNLPHAGDSTALWKLSSLPP